MDEIKGQFLRRLSLEVSVSTSSLPTSAASSKASFESRGETFTESCLCRVSCDFQELGKETKQRPQKTSFSKQEEKTVIDCQMINFTLHYAIYICLISSNITKNLRGHVKMTLSNVKIVGFEPGRKRTYMEQNID